MTLRVEARVERFALGRAFVISRGAKTHVDVVTCTLTAPDGVVGEGEGTPLYYLGETAQDCAAAIAAWAAKGAHEDRARLQGELPPGAARNALDCALWDLAARRARRPLWEIAGVPAPRPVPTAFTISLGEPDAMSDAAAAVARAGARLIKLKLGGDGRDVHRVEAVRAACPDARIIVDANEAFAPATLGAALAGLAAAGAEMAEQPLPAGADGPLAQVSSPIPVCADESCQTAADLPGLAGRYHAINIKLDKCGGLTAALDLARAAQGQGLEIMVGCMLCTSLAARPALLLGQMARWVDLDGPALLAQDRPGGLRYGEGMIWPD